MSQIASIFESETDWISGLPEYQRSIARDLLAGGASNEEAALRWLEATGADETAPFGVGETAKIYFSHFVDQLHEFLCTDSKDYAAPRKELESQVNLGPAAVVSGIATVMAQVLGSAPAFLAPVVAMILYSIGLIGLKAWCAMQTERRKMRDASDG